jgi:hypothetical protein
LQRSVVDDAFSAHAGVVGGGPLKARSPHWPAASRMNAAASGSYAGATATVKFFPFTFTL